MMRANATIPALLALAALYLFPADSLAKPTHYKRTAGSAHATTRHATAISHVHTRHTVSHHGAYHTIRSPASTPRPVTERPALPSVEEAASTPVILPTLYNKRGRLIVPPPLKGSHEILVHQNEVADRDGLDRIQNDEDLLDMRREGFLVSLPAANGLEVDERLPANRRYCRPWTAEFLSTLARAHYARFHSPLQVNSAVRTVEF